MAQDPIHIEGLAQNERTGEVTRLDFTVTLDKTVTNIVNDKTNSKPGDIVVPHGFENMVPMMIAAAYAEMHGYHLTLDYNHTIN